MTLVVHTLLEAHGTEDWTAWKLDYRTRGDVLGEISVGHEHYYFPPAWLEGDDARRRGCRPFEPEPGGFWVVEMGREDLPRICGPNDLPCKAPARAEASMAEAPHR